MFLSRYLTRPVQRTVLYKAKHTLPDLPYDYCALEPVICGEIMQLHYFKHHAGYVTNYNIAEERLQEALAKCDIKAIISLAPILKFNGGGHINHSIFWESLSAHGGCPEGELLTAIQRDFGSVDTLKKQLSQLAIGIQGSGWAWLGYDKQRKRLQLASCMNQDPLEATTGLAPILGIDVWEHAYYLQYKNARPDYVNKIWEVINWKNCVEVYSKLIC